MENETTPTTTRRRWIAAGTLLVVTALVGVAARIGGSTQVFVPGPGETPRFAAPSSGPVTFEGRLDRTAVLLGGDGLVRAELVIGAAPDRTVRSARVPTDLVVVLDRSGSMGGDKIADARGAVRELIAQLGPDDRFALVTYSDEAALVLPLASGGDGVRDQWLRTIDGIQADGSTNMSSALDLALDTIERARTSGRVQRAVLISDGLANRGDASPDGLVGRARRAARGEYILSSVGVGADFNEDLMTALADAGSGNYHYLQGTEDLAAVFGREFDAARRTVASGLAVRIEPGPGVSVVDAAGYPLERTAGATTFRPGALFAGQQRRVWVTFAVPHDAVATHGLGRFTLAYDDGRERTTLALPEEPRIACVRGEDDFFAGVDIPAWTRSVVEEGYGKLQAEVAREVKSGRRDEAVGLINKYRVETSALNDRLKSAPVASQLQALDKLEAEVGAAFSGPGAPARQNELGKTMGAEARDQRRVGAKN
jgi:Ca-activated chloride channel family protein